jgi:hypothetical protein
MKEKDWRQLTRYLATRVVGLAALGGIATLGVGTLGAGTANGASKAQTETTPVATSVSFTMNLRVTLPGQYATELHAHGKTDFVHHAMEASVTLPPVGLHASQPESAGTLLGPKPLVLQALWVDGHAYVLVPASLAALVGGAKALSIPVPATDANKVATAFTQSSVALSYAHLLLSELAQHQQQHRMGTRTIDGVSASGTEVDLTLAQLLKVVPGLSPAMSDESQALEQTSIPVTVWVDHKGRLVEVAMAATNSSVGSVSGTVQFFDYDGSVTVAAPAAGTVKPIPQSVEQLLNGLDLFGVTPFA